METTNQSQHPVDRTAGHDLDPDADGDLVLDGLRVAQTQALVVAIQTQDGESASVTVDWEDANGNVYQSESASDIGLSAVTDDWARLVRKGPAATVTVTSDASAGTQNRVNAFADTHR